MAHPLEDRFWELAFNQAKISGFGFAPDCERYLRGMITDGVNQIQSEDVGKAKAKLANAEDNLRRFVSAMVDEAKRRGFPLLREDTFYSAKRGLCPIWPFC